MSATGQQGNNTHYESTPGAKKGGRALATFENFQREFHEREKEIATQLPPNVNRERFLAAAMAAVKQNIDLLLATPRTLFTALVKAAQDGLLPDGREGVITVYNTNVAPKGQPAAWEKHAQWNPMILGLRKRARELDGLVIDAQVVHENDRFVWDQGDEPRLEHKPAQLGTPRGALIGAYAIFKREDGTIIHREVMDRDQIEATREQSKAPNSLMWTKFVTEGYRKSVARRGFKTVPVTPQLERIVRRDDDLFEFNNERTLEGTATPVPPPPPPPPPSPEPPPPPPSQVSHQPAQDVRAVIGEIIPPGEREFAPLTEEDERNLDRRSFQEMRGETPEDDNFEIPGFLRRGEAVPPPPPGPQPPRDEMAEWVGDQIILADKATTMPLLDAIDDEVSEQTADASREDLRAKWNDAYGRNRARLRKK